MNVASHIFGTHKPLLTQAVFALQLLAIYKIGLNNIGILYQMMHQKLLITDCLKIMLAWKYILIFLDNKNVIELCKFRTASHKLSIEIGRWTNTDRHSISYTHSVINMNSVMKFTIFQIAHSLKKIERSTYQTITDHMS